MLIGADETDEEDEAGSLEGEADLLRWPPPPLDDPETIRVPPGGPGGVIRMDTDRDYIIRFPDTPVRKSISIAGGRNVVIMGGEIDIGWQGEDPYIRDRTGLTVYNVAGVLHVEGLLIHGEDLTEGIQIDAPDAVIQIVNVGIFNVSSRDPGTFSDNHPDVIQPWGGFRELRVDKLSASSDYQGIFLKPDFGPLGPVTLSRVNLVGLPTARYLLWFEPREFDGPVVLEKFWIDVPEERDGGLGNMVWPAAQNQYPNQALMFVDNSGNDCVAWPEEMIPHVIGFVCEGIPPDGEFVSADAIGIGYVSLGYQEAGDQQ